MFAKGITMQPLCTADEQCLNFFPDMGFRPAVHGVQRDQYGDQIRIIPESLSLIKVDPVPFMVRGAFPAPTSSA